MNRVIKFRAWDPTLEKMRKVSLIEFIEKDIQVTVEMMPEAHGLYEMPIGHPVLMQFTGLLDKHGKEIYESDIINDGFGGTVFWDEHLAGFYIENSHASALPMDHYKNIEVIGNRYQNPELIKEP